VRSGNIDVGNETATRKPDKPSAEPAKRCGAMAQQGGDGGHGHQSAPQKLLQLVGCRETKTKLAPKLRPKPIQR
jgi:hypothetical protein